MKKIVVTGGSGKAGRACVSDLLAHGYEVVVIDKAVPADKRAKSIRADLLDFGQAIDALSTVEAGPSNVHAVVHLAAIPAPRLFPNSHTFQNNTVSDYNVFESCRRLGIKNIVWASSETVLGLPFDAPPPYAPVDEQYTPRPESAYSLSKVLSEEMARQFCRWDPELKIIGLRFSNVMEVADYTNFPSFNADLNLRKWNLWGYIDARDAAQAIRKSIEARLTGAEVFIIANADTVMSRSSSDLMKSVFPQVKITKELSEFETLLSIEKAKRILGYTPQFTWRQFA